MLSLTPDGYGPSIHTIIITMNVEDTSESIYNKSIYIYNNVQFEWLGCWMVGLVGLSGGWVYEALYVGRG